MLTNQDDRPGAEHRLSTAVEPTGPPPWRDPTREVADRVADLMQRLTLPEKVAQLYSVWLGAGAAPDDMAPYQHELDDTSLDWEELIPTGLGQLTRPFGTTPVEPAEGVRRLVRLQQAVVAASRLGIPALAHEECLTGFTTYRATIYPTPLAWGACFDPTLIEAMAGQIGTSLRAAGIHQGLAPVLDVSRDPRWGRTEETIGEDPYLVGTVGAAYVRGLQSAGIVATLKHFAGYSASRAGRNFAPAAIGPREFADVLLPPFEMALRDGGARSVMHSYAEVDGVPAAADPALLTTLLRDTWGFTGTVVADYFGIAFLHSLHHVAAGPAEAARLALAAGVDVELPNVHCFGQPLLDGLAGDETALSHVDRALRRVLTQKCELGLLDPDWSAVPADPEPDFNPPAARQLARTVAEQSVVLLHNDGILPLRQPARLAVVGPLADDPHGMLGCYTFPRHVGVQHPQLPMGVDVPTVLSSLRDSLADVAAPGVSTFTNVSTFIGSSTGTGDLTVTGGSASAGAIAGAGDIVTAPGCSVDGDDTSGIAAAVAAAAQADVCVAVLGDHSGLFGKGTSGEGCDRDDLSLPGMQGELLRALLDTGTPVVLVLLTGRPYALGAYADRLAAIVQAFFPGQEGGAAVAGVLTGRVCPSGRLPISVPALPGGQPNGYLTPHLGHATSVSSVDPTPLFPFGHGRSYTSFTWDDVTSFTRDDVTIDGAARAATPVSTDGQVEVSLTVRNTGDRPGADVVQLYLHDPVAQVTRPVVRLIGYARVELAPGQARRVTFTVHSDLTSFVGRGGTRIVEPGDVELRLGASSTDITHTIRLSLTGPTRQAGPKRTLTTGVSIADM